MGHDKFWLSFCWLLVPGNGAMHQTARGHPDIVPQGPIMVEGRGNIWCTDELCDGSFLAARKAGLRA